MASDEQEVRRRLVAHAARLDEEVRPITAAEARATPAPVGPPTRSRVLLAVAAALVLLAGLVGLWLVRSDDAEEGYVDSVDREVDLTTGWVSIDDPFDGGSLIRLAANDTEAIAIVESEPPGGCPGEGPCATQLAAWRSLDGITWTVFDELPDEQHGDLGIETYVEGVGWTGDRWLALGARDQLPTYWEIDGEPGVDIGTTIEGRFGSLTSLSSIDGQLWFGGTASEVEPARGPGLWLADAALGSPPRAIDLSIPDESSCTGAYVISEVVAGGPGLVAVSRGCLPGVWTSSDGEEWTSVGLREKELPNGDIVVGQFSDAVSVGGEVLIVGEAFGWPAMWRLGRAGAVNEVENLPGMTADDEPPPDRGILGIEAGRHGIVAAGSVEGAQSVWASSDGTTWDLADLGPASDYAPLGFVAALGDRFIVASLAAPPSGEGSLHVWLPPGSVLDLVEYESEARPAALTWGTLVIDGDCLMIDNEGELVATVWPRGSRVVEARDGSLAVADDAGGVAALGAEVRLGGGNLSREAVRTGDFIGPADACLTTARVWMVGGVARGSAGLME